MDIRPSRGPGGFRWKLFQFAIFAGFITANIELEWGITGIAVPVMGGMLAWYATGLVSAVLDFAKAKLRLPPYSGGL